MPRLPQILQGGYDAATRELEAGFKIVGQQRVFADDECYPDPEAIAAEAQESDMGIEVVVSPRFASVQDLNVVNVVSGETECNRVVLAIRAGPKGRLFVLDSDFGPVYVKGDHRAQRGHPRRVGSARSGS